MSAVCDMNKQAVRNHLGRCIKIGIGLGALANLMGSCNLDYLDEANSEALIHLSHLVELCSDELLHNADLAGKAIDKIGEIDHGSR